MTDYSDIIDLPHHVSPNRPRMSREARAAQFSAFSAITGHRDGINSTTLRHAESYEPTYEEDGYGDGWSGWDD